LVIQDANYMKNVKCFKEAVAQPAGNYNRWCTKYEDIVYMKLTEYSEQTISLGEDGYELGEVKFLPEKTTMSVGRKMNNVRNQRIGREEVDQYPAVDYETLW